MNRSLHYFGVWSAVLAAAFFFSLIATHKSIAGHAKGAISESEKLESIRTRSIWMLNAYRQKNGLPQLKGDKRLFASAGKFAFYLSSTGKFDHEADGRAPRQRMTAEGLAPCTTAENLAYFATSEVEAPAKIAFVLFDMLRKSPGHNKNMLLEAASHIGIGVAKKDGEETYSLVQNFWGPCS